MFSALIDHVRQYEHEWQADGLRKKPEPESYKPCLPYNNTCDMVTVSTYDNGAAAPLFESSLHLLAFI
ncbi:unnamed protein product [Brassica rapa subsp. narinosa]|uniref:(rape) hypothetical protein n=1 Tax=Brassica napus TaxID=3708 RepID=A0A816VX00_BRANA|nr:unnamed protein product [Brassica napus]CAF2160817.1 unnamed protein product [Brassica napus]